MSSPVRALRNEQKSFQIGIVKKTGGSFFNLTEKLRIITDSYTSRVKVFPLCLLSQWQVIILACISGTGFRAGYCARASMMVVRSRLQLTLAILKPDLMMHPVRIKVRKVLVRFLHCSIRLFMRQSHIISHKTEWLKVETYNKPNVMGLCENLTPAYP